jgi:hypothetical protein
MLAYLKKIIGDCLIDVEHSKRVAIFTSDLITVLYRELDVDTIKDMTYVSNARNGLLDMIQSGNYILTK